MPTVPVLSKEKISPSTTTNPVIATSQPKVTSSLLQQELAQAVQQETQDKGYVSTAFLDHFAQTHRFDQAADGPAGWDYEALRITAQQEEQINQQAQQIRRRQEQASWLTQVASATADNASLQAYLDVQMPVYQQCLEEDGVSAVHAQATVHALRGEAVQRHVERSLAGGDWNNAQEVLTHQAAYLPEGRRQRLAQQVRHSFANNEGKRLWQQAQAQSDEITQQQAIALAHINESDEILAQDIRKEIEMIASAAKAQQAADKSALFTQLAQVSAAQAVERLSNQQLLQGDTLHQAYRAAQQAHQKPSQTQQVWFVENYFNDSVNLAQAFEQAQCAPRDYFRLQAMKYRRQSGQDSKEEKWLCEGIEHWMKQQGFDEKKTAQAVYDVLTAATDSNKQLEKWKKIKTLLTC